MVLGTTIKCPHFLFFIYLFTMSNAYENALTTGKTVVRRWWVNPRSTKNQVSVQYAQQIERPATASSVESKMIALEQGTPDLGNKTGVTAIRSLSAEQAVKIFGAMEGTCYNDGDKLYFADDIYGFATGIEVVENFERNPYSSSQEPKVNPSTGEVVKAFNSATGTNMPVYRHTKLTAAEAISHSFLQAASADAAPAAQIVETLQMEGAGLQS